MKENDEDVPKSQSVDHHRSQLFVVLAIGRRYQSPNHIYCEWDEDVSAQNWFQGPQ